MSYWNSSESNPLKIILVIILLGLAGYFIYSASHQSALQDTAQVASNNTSATTGSASGTGTGTNPGGGKGTQGGGETEGCKDGASLATLVPGLGAPISVTNVTTASGMGGHNQVRGMFTIANTGRCPVKLTDLSFVINTNFINSWVPMQNIKAFVGTTMFGTMLPFPTPDTALCASSNARCVLAFSNPAGYLLNPGTTAQIRVVSDALNIATPTPSGAPVWFNVQFEKFTAQDVLTTATYNWTTSGTPITAATITVH